METHKAFIVLAWCTVNSEHDFLIERMELASRRGVVRLSVYDLNLRCACVMW